MVYDGYYNVCTWNFEWIYDGWIYEIFWFEIGNWRCEWMEFVYETWIKKWEM